MEKIGPVAFRLKLPPSLKIHDVFHASLLEHSFENPFPSRNLPRPEPDIVDGEEEFEVETILDSRIYRKRLQYLVHWKGYSTTEATWEPATHVQNAPQAIEDFHHTHPDRPGPTK